MVLFKSFLFKLKSISFIFWFMRKKRQLNQKNMNSLNKEYENQNDVNSTNHSADSMRPFKKIIKNEVN